MENASDLREPFELNGYIKCAVDGALSNGRHRFAFWNDFDSSETGSDCRIRSHIVYPLFDESKLQVDVWSDDDVQIEFIIIFDVAMR